MTSSSPSQDFLLTRRAVLGSGLCAALNVWAADWPDRPVRVVIGYPPGGSADGVTRPLLPALEKALGQPFVMDYRPGAGGATAAEFVARSPADGYIVQVIEGGVIAAMPYLRKLPFDPVRAFKPIGMVAVGGSLIVTRPESTMEGVADLIKAAKMKPGQINYGTSGTGGPQHLAAEQFQAATGIKLQHVPYKGGAQAMTDLLGGQIQLLFSSMAPAIPFVKSGKIKALGVTSSTRASSLPDVPTVAEQGVSGFDNVVWLALAAPAGLPPAVAARLESALESALASPDVQAGIRSQGYEPTVEGSAALARRIRADTDKWEKVIGDAKIKLD